MSNVYMDNGTAVEVLRFEISTTVHDYQTDTTLWTGDVPDHLSEHYSVTECAEWATQWVDEVYGLPVALDDSAEDYSTFGMLGQSYNEHYRAGARYGITVCVVGIGKGYTLTHSNGHVDTFLSESEAVHTANYVYQPVLGTTEVTL